MRKELKKQTRLAACLSAALLLGVNGCGTPEARETAEAPVINIVSGGEDSETENPETENTETENTETENPPASPETDAPDTQIPENTDDDTGWYAEVRSVEDGKMIVSKNEVDENVMVSYAEGSTEEVLVNVYISENTKYEIRTIKNGGVNGEADVEKSEASFSDIKKDVSVKLFGYYEGEDFHAEQVVIVRSA